MNLTPFFSPFRVDSTYSNTKGNDLLFQPLERVLVIIPHPDIVPDLFIQDIWDIDRFIVAIGKTLGDIF